MGPALAAFADPGRYFRDRMGRPHLDECVAGRMRTATISSFPERHSAWRW